MILHSQILGEGKPFVILHGFLGMSDNWKTLGTQFSEDGYEVHLLDLRNHGRSFHSDDFSYDFMVKDLEKYCEEKNLENIILLGHSMGGKVAMEYASKNPGNVERLIVVDISPRAYPPHHQDILNALDDLDFSKISTRQEAEEELSKSIKEVGVRLFLLKNLYRKSKDEFGLRINLPVLKDSMEVIGVSLSEDAIFPGKTLFINGGNSDYIREEDRELIKNHFPDARIETIQDAGHWVHAEQPEAFYEAVSSFLD